METILKEGYWKIMRLFYENKKAKIHLRAIARKTGLNENSVTRFLENLKNNGILKYEKEGNLKKYSAEENNKIYLIFSIFDIEKFNNLPNIRKSAIALFFRKLKEKPVIEVLFGSTAKETYNKESDIDILLIVNSRINTEEAENYAEAQTGLKISCFQISYSDFVKEIKIKEDKVIASAINSGYPLANHIKYYEEILA